MRRRGGAKARSSTVGTHALCHSATPTHTPTHLLYTVHPVRLLLYHRTTVHPPSAFTFRLYAPRANSRVGVGRREAAQLDLGASQDSRTASCTQQHACSCSESDSLASQDPVVTHHPHQTHPHARSDGCWPMVAESEAGINCDSVLMRRLDLSEWAIFTA